MLGRVDMRNQECERTLKLSVAEWASRAPIRETISENGRIQQRGPTDDLKRGVIVQGIKV